VGVLRRLVQLGALGVALWAVAYAILPYSTSFPQLPASRLPGLRPGPAVPGSRPPRHATPACTRQARSRLYQAAPVVVLDLIAVAGLSRILA